MPKTIPAFIIEEINRREREQRQEQERIQPTVQVPIPEYPEETNNEPQPEHGIAIIDFNVKTNGGNQ